MSGQLTFHVLTLFPDMITQMVSHSILGRAITANHINVNPINIRDYAINQYGQVDDAPYGGGAGMVMMAQPVFDAWEFIQTPNSKPRTIYLTPQGKPFTQIMATELAQEASIILICGHYEGLDERIIEEIVTDEISIGDYVLTGGEPAALVVMDAIARLVPQVLNKSASHEDESFSPTLNGGLEYPHYTRPAVFRGREVPAVLLSGHHGNIADWRLAQSQKRTQIKRPDLSRTD